MFRVSFRRGSLATTDYAKLFSHSDKKAVTIVS